MPQCLLSFSSLPMFTPTTSKGRRKAIPKADTNSVKFQAIIETPQNPHTSRKSQRSVQYQLRNRYYTVTYTCKATQHLYKVRHTKKNETCHALNSWLELTANQAILNNISIP
jgi:hypothetical protein